MNINKIMQLIIPDIISSLLDFILPKEQTGFQPGHFCVDHISCISIITDKFGSLSFNESLYIRHFSDFSNIRTSYFQNHSVLLTNRSSNRFSHNCSFKTETESHIFVNSVYICYSRYCMFLFPYLHYHCIESEFPNPSCNHLYPAPSNSVEQLSLLCLNSTHYLFFQ